MKLLKNPKCVFFYGKQPNVFARTFIIPRLYQPENRSLIYIFLPVYYQDAKDVFSLNSPDVFLELAATASPACMDFYSSKMGYLLHSEYVLRRGASLENAKDWLCACAFQYLALSDNKEHFNKLMEQMDDNDDWVYDMTFNSVSRDKNSNKTSSSNNFYHKEMWDIQFESLVDMSVPREYAEKKPLGT